MPADARPYTLNIVSEAPERPALVICPKCGRNRWNNVGPHAPRNTAAGLVDCVGEVINGNP